MTPDCGQVSPVIHCWFSPAGSLHTRDPRAAREALEIAALDWYAKTYPATNQPAEAMATALLRRWDASVHAPKLLGHPDLTPDHICCALETIVRFFQPGVDGVPLVADLRSVAVPDQRELAKRVRAWKRDEAWMRSEPLLASFADELRALAEKAEPLLVPWPGKPGAPMDPRTLLGQMLEPALEPIRGAAERNRLLAGLVSDFEFGIDPETKRKRRSRSEITADTLSNRLRQLRHDHGGLAK